MTEPEKTDKHKHGRDWPERIRTERWRCQCGGLSNMQTFACHKCGRVSPEWLETLAEPARKLADYQHRTYRREPAAHDAVMLIQLQGRLMAFDQLARYLNKAFPGLVHLLDVPGGAVGVLARNHVWLRHLADRGGPVIIVPWDRYVWPVWELEAPGQGKYVTWGTSGWRYYIDWEHTANRVGAVLVKVNGEEHAHLMMAWANAHREPARPSLPLPVENIGHPLRADIGGRTVRVAGQGPEDLRAFQQTQLGMHPDEPGEVRAGVQGIPKYAPPSIHVSSRDRSGELGDAATTPVTWPANHAPVDPDNPK